MEPQRCTDAGDQAFLLVLGGQIIPRDGLPGAILLLLLLFFFLLFSR